MFGKDDSLRDPAYSPATKPQAAEGMDFGTPGGNIPGAAPATAPQPAPAPETAMPEAAPTYATPAPDTSMEALIEAQRSDTPPHAAQPADGVRHFSDLNLPKADVAPPAEQQPLSPSTTPLEPQRPALEQPAGDAAGLAGHPPVSAGQAEARHARSESPDNALKSMITALSSPVIEEVNGYTHVQAAGLLALAEQAQQNDPGALAQLAAGGSELIAQVAQGFPNGPERSILADSSYALTKAGVISPIPSGVTIQQQATPQRPMSHVEIATAGRLANERGDPGQYL